MSGISVVTKCILPALAVLLSCAEPQRPNEPATATEPAHSQPLFSLLPPETSGVQFRNDIKESLQLNVLVYEYYHNGGGVAVGDINNDGLSDLYFTGNLSPNRLYLNQGNLNFKDITELSGCMGEVGFSTGTCMVDINGDGWLDIYECRSGSMPPDMRRNKLYINNQNNTFTEQAAAFGLDDPANSTQAAFFDYDLDGDLDCFLLNHAIAQNQSSDFDAIRATRDPFAGDKLFRNDNGLFKDVSALAGIHGNPIGFGLGIAVGDLNQDGFPDMYVANDYLEHDYLYINNGDGTFEESIKPCTGHISNYGMGCDIADFDSDGLLDIVVADMAAEDHYRAKANMSGMNPDLFYSAVDNGFHYQYMYNTLQQNNGQQPDGSVDFSEIGQQAGIAKTDWSWAPLLADFDLDGEQDLFVTNGLKQDIRNNDWLAKVRAFAAAGRNLGNDPAGFQQLLSEVPSQKLVNYAFRNNGNLGFDHVSEEWGFTQPTFSNGAVYADLDNDGDLEIVVSNVDDVAHIYRNNAVEQSKGNWLRVQLIGPPGNPDGIGCRLTLTTTDGARYVREQQPVRGYQSSVDRTVHFGLPTDKKVAELLVEWPGEKTAKRYSATSNSLVKVNRSQGTPVDEANPTSTSLFAAAEGNLGIRFKHTEDAFDEFEKEVLLPHGISKSGPGMAVGDLNSDGLMDLFVGGAAGQNSAVYLQSKTGTFAAAVLDEELLTPCEIVGAQLADFDGDNIVDLLAISGGTHVEQGNPLLKDLFYKNKRNLKLDHKSTALPDIAANGSCIATADFDSDGDLDVFVGSRSMPGNYPTAPTSYLLRNDGGTFTDITSVAAPDGFAGMVTDATWVDVNNDKLPDLVVAYEWDAIRVYENNGTNLSPTDFGIGNLKGWWNCVVPADLDGDGDLDLVVGNLGMNYKFHASQGEPLQLNAADFDGNGSLDIVLSYADHGERFPVRGRQCSSEQMPMITERFPTYHAFASSNLEGVYGTSALDQSLQLSANTFANGWLENSKGKFVFHAFGANAQRAAANAAVVHDFNGDGQLDVLLAGNKMYSEVETPRNDAGRGCLLLGDGKGGFEYVHNRSHGLWLDGEVRSLEVIMLANGQQILVAGINDAEISVLRLLETKSN